MWGNSSENWYGDRRFRSYRHGGNFWVFGLIMLGLIVLTHGWILFLPLMALTAFAFFGFVLPRLLWHMHNGDWQNRDWAAWADEKRKRHTGRWQNWNGWDDRDSDEKPKRSNPDNIDYV